MGLDQTTQSRKLSGKVQIHIFSITNTEFKALGELQQFDSLIWPDAYNGYAQMQLFAPITAETSELLKKDYILWSGDETACMIESIKSIVDKDGIKSFQVKGRTLEKILEKRIVWQKYYKTGYTSDIMYDIVNRNCVSPIDSKRKIPWLYLASDRPRYGTNQIYQKTGGTVYTALYDLAAADELGFTILFKPKEKKLEFKVVKGRDLTRSNVEGNTPVEFSTDLNDILSSIYYVNIEDEVNMALVAGEESGTSRAYATTGDLVATGLMRKELWVDARDLQSEFRDEDGNEQSLTPVQYNQSMRERGNQKIAAKAVVESFEATVRIFGEVQYVFGRDYIKGDKVTMIDKELGVTVSARITESEEGFGSQNYSLQLTFGYSYPTIGGKVRKLEEQ